MQKDFIIRLEQPKDFWEVENLTRETFWNVYGKGCVEHYVLHQFRNSSDFIPQLDFVLEKDGILIGHIMYAKAFILTKDNKKVEIFTFGPLSILPKFQHKGYGSILLNYSMQQAKQMGAPALAICGNIKFYEKFGFVIAKNVGITYASEPDADYFLIKELKPNFLKNIKGTFEKPKGYFVDKNEANEFDKQFPLKLN